MRALIGFALGLLAVPAAAQSMLEHATAAAGGSAAGVAGKKVSDSLDSVMTKVSELGKKSASDDKQAKGRRLPPPIPPEPKVRLASRPAPPAPPAPRTVAGPPQATLRLNNRIVSVPLEAVPTPVPEPAPAVSEPPRPLPTAADLQSLSPGSSREEVADKLGKPAGRITLYDERGLVEVYSFRSQGTSLGSVHMVNGKVTQVRPAQQ
ncbi:MAG: hypothetical protein HY235_30735 [Acidobacteria bacterium]|nr:hypothetical protein [Acidobacteriota bacterium]